MPANEIMALARDFATASGEVQRALVSVAEDVGDETAEKWAENVRGWTRGIYAKHYPNAITAKTVFSLSGFDIEVGPESGRPQGSMGRGFEFGSQNSAANPDGLAAQKSMEPHLERKAADRLDRAMP